MRVSKYKSVIAHVAIYVAYIALLALLAQTSKDLNPLDTRMKLILLIANYVMFGVTIAVRVGLCVGFPTRAQRIAIPAVFAVISIAISLWLFFGLYSSYKYFWTLAAADVASVFIGIAKK